LRCVILLLAVLAPGMALAKAETAPEAVLTVANRDIATLRMTMLGASSELRVKRAHERLRQMDERELSKPITPNTKHFLQAIFLEPKPLLMAAEFSIKN
jgi:hypothetical protein